jgi:hypothetical protein
MRLGKKAERRDKGRVPSHRLLEQRDFRQGITSHYPTGAAFPVDLSGA